MLNLCMYKEREKREEKSEKGRRREIDKCKIAQIIN